jgi:apolipoprotein N-acyltransferase
MPPTQKTAETTRTPLLYDVGLVLASAFLIALAQCWAAFAWLCLIGLVPLLVALRNSSFIRTWFNLWLFYCAYFIASVWWLRAAGGGMGWALAIVPFYFAVPFLIPAAGLALNSSWKVRLLAFPFLWTGLEFVVRLSFLRLNWTIVGLPLADYPLLSQVVSLCGPEGTTFVAASVNVLIVLLVMLEGKRRMLAGAGALALVAAVLGFGFLRAAGTGPGASFKLGLVQPDIPEEIVWTPQVREPYLGRLTSLIDRAKAGGPDVIVLPEGAINGLVRYDKRLTDFVRTTVTRTHTPLLFGSYDKQDNAFSNVAIYIDPFDTVTTYRKIRLAPLMEYEPAFFPFRRPANWLRFTAGTERTVFSTVTGYRFSTMICLEDSMPELARDFALRGAQFLMALVSTERFEGTSEPLQHFRRARLTAIAVGLPMVRCANSGISGWINPYGRVEKTLDAGRQEAVVVKAQLSSVETVYRSTGDWPWLGGMLIAGFAISTILRRYLLRDS